MKKLLVLSFFLCIIYSVSFAESKYETTAMAIPEPVGFTYKEQFNNDIIDNYLEFSLLDNEATGMYYGANNTVYIYSTTNSNNDSGQITVYKGYLRVTYNKENNSGTFEIIHVKRLQKKITDTTAFLWEDIKAIPGFFGKKLLYRIETDNEGYFKSYKFVNYNNSFNYEIYTTYDTDRIFASDDVFEIGTCWNIGNVKIKEKKSDWY